ncbi:MAG: short chain dehydrogenase [Crocinitomicaceae bacterium]|nr:short chain dehydrogenase [Crocinitomicaceae bacterium]|tara:strand:- start:128 stop:925 length:798 start_codon:yes stop_codon:yes gene_type:complete
MNFKNKVCWVTGASSGIGEALCYIMAKQGARLVLSSRNAHALEKVKSACKSKGAKECVIIAIDLADPSSIDRAFKSFSSQFSSLDFLVNNGGISQRGLALETDFKVDRKVMEVNFFGAVNLTKKVLPLMIKQGSGNISITSSVVGKFGFPQRTAYSASKHAVQGFYEALRTEVEKEGLKVSIIIPGRVKTNISIHALEGDGSEHGKMDAGQEEGMPVDKAVQIIAKGLLSGKREIMVGGKELKLVQIRRFFPSLFYKIVARIKHT